MDSTISAPTTQGQVIAWPRIYDLILLGITRGRESAFRQKVADLARLQHGETVLDVGCGTGTQAIVAKQRVGDSGSVAGIEPSPRMIAYARRKATRRKLSIDFQPGVIEHLTFPDQSFDVVLCIIVLHHMSDDLKHQGVKEIIRVLKPGGRLLVIDSNLHLLPPFERMGFQPTEQGEMPLLSDYNFALWTLNKKS
ncbi:MAG: class I SAM-dependent methyltransferase [Chloroflexota bacterium]